MLGWHLIRALNTRPILLKHLECGRTYCGAGQNEGTRKSYQPNWTQARSTSACITLYCHCTVHCTWPMTHSWKNVPGCYVDSQMINRETTEVQIRMTHSWNFLTCCIFDVILVTATGLITSSFEARLLWALFQNGRVSPTFYRPIVAERQLSEVPAFSGQDWRNIWCIRG